MLDYKIVIISIVTILFLFGIIIYLLLKIKYLYILINTWHDKSYIKNVFTILFETTTLIVGDTMRQQSQHIK